MNKAHLILGTAQIEPGYGVARERLTSNLDWKALFAEARACGFSALDTAALYPLAHTTIGQSEWDRAIHTKLPSLRTLMRDYALAKADLNRETLDLVYFHRAPKSVAEEVELRNLAKSLRGEGVRSVGLSVYHPAEIEPILDVEEITHVQIPLNVLDQRFLGDSISNLKKSGKTIIVRSVFLQGLLASQAPLESFAGVPRDLLGHLSLFRSEAAARDLSPMQFALGFVRGIAGIAGVIIGCETVAQVRESSNFWTNSRFLQIDHRALSKLGTTEEALVDPRNW